MVLFHIFQGRSNFFQGGGGGPSANQPKRLHSVIECNLLTSIGVIVLVSAMDVRWQNIL